MKLVSLKNAKAADVASFNHDVQALGNAMIQISSDAKERDDKLVDIRSYDPSLFFLLEWMTSKDPPSMTEVLRHPYFMSPSERQTFAIAIGGGMIAEYLQAPPRTGLSVITEAIMPRLNEHLKTELDRLIARTHQQNLEAVALAAVAAAAKADADAAAAREVAVAAAAAAADAAAAAAVLAGPVLPVDAPEQNPGIEARGRTNRGVVVDTSTLFQGQEAVPAEAAASAVPVDAAASAPSQVEAAPVNSPVRRGRGGGGFEQGSGGGARGGGGGVSRGAGGSALPPVGRGNFGGADPPMSGDD